jgi:23S rRNA (uridine2552-2'-O)-methyltransferase
MKKPTGRKGGKKSGGATAGQGDGEGRQHSGRGLAERGLKTRVKTARGRRLSSTLWLERQLNDPYVKRAKAEGYASRAAYKLKEIDDRHHLLKPGAIVIDLGAAPGGWTQVSVERTGSSLGDIRVVGIDYLEMDPVPGATILHLDFLDESAPRRLLEATAGRAPDLVLSDMASPTIGHRRTDHLRTMHLVEVALDFAISVLKPGGHFLAKTFQGGTEAQLLERMKRHFRSVHHVKPPASRDGSVELYLLAKDFKGRPLDATERKASPEMDNDL